MIALLSLSKLIQSILFFHNFVLTFGSAWKGTLVRFVTGLLAVVTQPFRRGANLSVMAYIAALVTSSSCDRRHGETGPLYAVSND